MLKYLAGFESLLYNKTKAVVSRPHVEGPSPALKKKSPAAFVF